MVDVNCEQSLYFLYSLQSTMLRLRHLKLVVSPTYYNSKLDQFGKGNDTFVDESLRIEKTRLAQAQPEQELSPPVAVVNNCMMSVAALSNLTLSDDFQKVIITN